MFYRSELLTTTPAIHRRMNSLVPLPGSDAVVLPKKALFFKSVSHMHEYGIENTRRTIVLIQWWTDESLVRCPGHTLCARRVICNPTSVNGVHQDPFFEQICSAR